MTPANDNRPQSFDALLLQHEPYIRSGIYRLEKEISKRDDLYHDVLTMALERWSNYRPDNKFTGWLYWLILKAVLKRERSAAFGPTLPPTEPTQEYATDISLALSKMPRADEVLLSACGHSEADIARRAGVTPAAAHYRIKAARAVLVAANDNEPVRKSA